MKTFTLTENELRDILLHAYRSGYLYDAEDGNEPCHKSNEYVKLVIVELSNESDAKQFLPVTEFMISRGHATLGMEYENHPEKRFEVFSKLCEEHKNTMVQAVYSEINTLIRSENEAGRITSEQSENLRDIMRSRTV